MKRCHFLGTVLQTEKCYKVITGDKSFATLFRQQNSPSIPKAVLSHTGFQGKTYTILEMLFPTKALEATIIEMLARKEKAQTNKIQLEVSLCSLLFKIY